MKTQKTIISLDKASIYQGGIPIFKNITLNIESGNFIFLIGKTGSGKTSLIRTLYGDLPLLKGKGRVLAHQLHLIKQKEIPFLRRKIGFVFQDFKLLFDRNISDNFKFVLRATGWKDKQLINNRIDEILKKVGMQGVNYKYPYELSGGEQQRIAIGRALLNNPSIILADEPTGNLDPDTSDEIMKLFSSLNKKGLSILMATHNYHLISKYPSYKILRCEDSKIFEVLQKK